MKALLSLLALLTLTSAAFAQDKEYIIVSGGVSLMKWEQYKAQPHDKWWRNFLQAADIRMEQLRTEVGPDALVTWLVYSPAYKRRLRDEPADMFGLMNSIKAKYNVNLVYFDSGSDIINYLNSGRNRGATQIALFEYFGHSNKACFLFDYSNEIDSSSKAWLHEDELGRIRRDIWAPGAYAKSWGCHTGESMSQKWRQATGTAMIGATGKTQYMTHTLPILSTAGGRWTQ